MLPFLHALLASPLVHETAKLVGKKIVEMGVKRIQQGEINMFGFGRSFEQKVAEAASQAGLTNYDFFRGSVRFKYTHGPTAVIVTFRDGAFISKSRYTFRSSLSYGVKRLVEECREFMESKHIKVIVNTEKGEVDVYFLVNIAESMLSPQLVASMVDALSDISIGFDKTLMERNLV